MTVCSACGTHAPAGAKFCMECAAPLAAPTSAQSRKVVTAVFCDVTGSTELGSTLDPETLRPVMTS